MGCGGGPRRTRQTSWEGPSRRWAEAASLTALDYDLDNAAFELMQISEGYTRRVYVVARSSFCLQPLVFFVYGHITYLLMYSSPSVSCNPCAQVWTNSSNLYDCI